jgi:hypothetical protein
MSSFHTIGQLTDPVIEGAPDAGIAIDLVERHLVVVGDQRVEQPTSPGRDDR